MKNYRMGIGAACIFVMGTAWAQTKNGEIDRLISLRTERTKLVRQIVQTKNNKSNNPTSRDYAVQQDAQIQKLVQMDREIGQLEAGMPFVPIGKVDSDKTLRELQAELAGMERERTREEVKASFASAMKSGKAETPENPKLKSLDARIAALKTLIRARGGQIAQEERIPSPK